MPKEEKNGALRTLYENYGILDIKILNHYETGITTHVAVKKRNTVKGLQALIDGKYIVQADTFLKAITDATTPTLGGGKSPLEEDWEANFPDASKYLPERADEPTQREANAYAPNPVRQNMFEGYTFIFYDQKQYSNLLPPLTQGGGKAYVQEVVPDQTEVLDFVAYVKGMAGEKGLGSFDDGSDGKGVVVVRHNPVKGPGSAWFAGFNRDVALRLDHRLVEQNEFLDAVLGADASVLRRRLDFVQSGIVAPPPTASKSKLHLANCLC